MVDKDRPIKILEAELAELNPDMLDEADKIKECLVKDCLEIARAEYPNLKAREVEYYPEYRTGMYSYRLLLNLNIGANYKSIGNKMVSLTSTKDVKKQFREFLKAIDRQLFVS